MMLLETIYFLLGTFIAKIVSSDIISNSTISIELKKSYFPYKPIYDVAPEILDDQNFVIAVSTFNSSDLQSGLSVYLVGSETDTKCFMPLKLAKWVISSPVRRLNNKLVLLTVVNYNEEGKEEAKLLLVNMTDCNQTYIYNAALPESFKIFTSNNLTNGRFTLLLNNKDLCDGYNWCRLFFDPLYQRSEPLNFDFSYNEVVSIKPVTSFDGHLFITRLTNANGTHRIRLYDVKTNITNPEYKEFFIVESNEDVSKYGTAYYNNPVHLKTKTSGLSYCWSPKKMSLFKTIHCSIFQENGTVTLNQTIDYPKFRILGDIKPTPNGLVVISGKGRCGLTFECESVQVDVINSKGLNEIIKVEHYKYESECSIFDIKALQVRLKKPNGSIEIEYICGHGYPFYRVSYHTYTIE